MLQADLNLQISDQAHLFIVDEEGLLFSAARGEIYRLNSAAAFVWCALEDGTTRPDLVTELCKRCQLTAEEAASLEDDFNFSELNRLLGLMSGSNYNESCCRGNA